MTGRYEVRRLEVIEAWMETASPEQCRTMRTWVRAAMTGPHEMASGVLVNRGRPGRPLSYAVVPGTGCMVTYLVGDVPVRVVTFISVLPAPD